MALPSSGEISFGALADNRSSASRADIDIRAYSQTFASGATANSRDDLNSAPYSMDEFYSADYPNTVFENVVARIDTTVVTSNGYVDSETGARIYWDITGGGTDDYTAGLKYVSNNAILLSAVNTTNDTSTSNVYVTLGTIPDIAGGSAKYYPFVTTGTYTNAVGGNLTHYDQLAGGSPGLNETSREVTYSDQSIPNISITPTVSTGTQTGYTRGSITSVTAGDGGTMTGTYVTEEGQPTDAIVIANTPGVIAVAMTHHGNPSGRNNVASTQNYTVSYTRDIDISYSDGTVNSGVSFTIYATSEGLTGAATMRVGYGTSNSNTTYTDHSDKSIGAATQFVRNSQEQAFTRTLTSGTSLETFYGKAHYTSGAETINATAAIYIAPAFSYTATANATINVNQTQALAATSIVGNSAAIVITSSPSAGSGTNSATLTPGTNNRVYTITYDGAANYSQTQDYSRTVTVNPTVSLSLSDNQGGDNYPISDAHGSTITSGTHGVSPTLFTVAPTVVGDTVTYSWVTSGFTFTSGGGSTAGTVIFKKDSAGTTTQTLSVSGNSTSDSDAVSIVAQTVTKAFTGGTKPATLRAGTTFSVTSVAANYTQTVHLLRDGVTIGAAASISSTMNFSIAASNGYTNNYDSNAVATYLRDNDNTGITRNLGTTILLPPLPVIDSYSVVQDTAAYLGKIDLTWTTTSATAVSIDQSVGSQAVDGNYEKSGLSNNTAYTFTLTATNAASETAQSAAAATTINPSISFGTPSITSATYGDTGTYTIAITKNFNDAIEVHVGHGLNASQTGGTEWQILTGQGSGATSFTATFNRNYWGFAAATGDHGSIVDYRAGSSAAGWFHNDRNDSFANFAAPNVPTSLSCGASSGTAIAVSWSNPSGDFDAIEIWYTETAEDEYELNQTVTSGGTSWDAINLEVGTAYSFKLRSKRAESTTPLGSSETRTQYSSYTSVVQQSTVGWSSVVLEGDSFSGTTSGVGFSTQEAAHVASDETSGAIRYLDTTVLGTHTVSLRRGVDQGVFNGGNAWFGVGGDEVIAVAYVESGGDVTAANYILIANTKPYSPTSVSAGSETSSAITISWNNVSAIEDNYYIFYKTGTANDADYNDTSWGDNPLAANTTSDQVTGLSGGTDYSFVVYAKNGTAWSDASSGQRVTSETLVSYSFGSWSAEMFCTTIGQNDDDDSAEVTISLEGDSGTVLLALGDTDLLGSQGTLEYRMKNGAGGSWSGWGATPSVSVGSGTKTIYVMANLTQNKTVTSIESGDDTVRLGIGGVNSAYVDVNWSIRPEEVDP